ncbi:AAA family ATPase [Pacificibacter marinus]|uniref:Chromosome partitioning protein ParA n=1 Tax=Pacificibacter marinus TaxID=658057 RepID=A0A1Y5RGV6_9RHOB|nr:AAA family ATPase [Pacificibacter marinus]SEK19449.1 pilus assembly protein CpaE [Pacificibacter marinus]SLN17154.1 Chromosome partitioning protein ParA [Pacificibacter marinus]
MTSETALHTEQDQLIACTISRDVQNFDLLIEDMETELGESWGDLSFEDARQFFRQPESGMLKFVAVAIDHQDESMLAVIADLIKSAKAQDVKVILIADEVSPMALHQLLQLGAEDFIPYPLPENALQDAIARLDAPQKVVASDFVDTGTPSTRAANGIVLPVFGMSGGAGATTLAVNLAWELANVEKSGQQPRVLLMDLNLQFGSVSTYLDLPRREAVYELLSATEHMDDEAFKQALTNFNDKMSVLTAPADLLPLDFIENQDLERLMEMARHHFDYIVIDMPSTLVNWSEIILSQADIMFSPFELDMRSAQNILRLKSALKAEELPFEKFRFLLNRAPKGMDLSAKSRIKRMSESLDIAVEVQLPDGGKAVLQSNDQGLPLAIEAPKNLLRKEIQKLAASLHARQSEDLRAAAQ